MRASSFLILSPSRLLLVCLLLGLSLPWARAAPTNPVRVALDFLARVADDGRLKSRLAPLVITRAPEPLSPPPTQAIKVMLDWYLTPYHAPLIVARERDLFTRRGLDVDLVVPGDPRVPAKLVSAGRADLALTSQLQLHLLIDRGQPLIRVGTLVPVPLATLLTRQDITTLDQLAGKTVGYVQKAPARILLAALLEGRSTSLDELKLQRLDFALTPALARGDIDAAIGGLRHLSHRQLAQDGVVVQEIDIEESNLPSYEELILVANRTTLHQHRRRIAGFVDALQEATAWLVAHPEQGWELVRRAEPGLDTPANAQAWPLALRYLALRPGLLDARRYRDVETYLYRHGMVESLTPVKRLATDVGTTTR